MAIRNQEALDERANDLAARGLNGFHFLLVLLHPDDDPVEARLEVHFHNDNEIAHLLLTEPQNLKSVFPISGGHRLPAGPASGQVQVRNIDGGPAGNVVTLTVSPIGDYSTYTLSVDFPNIDPVFGEIAFKFRPGCFNLCAPDWSLAPEPNPDPVIDYLAKDYDSFKHTMISAMMERVPGWAATSEADLDQVLLETFSAAADELSDYQDRVMNEAYLATARKRVSLARHARLMDYHIHQGNQASTWLALLIAEDSELDLPQRFLGWSGGDFNDPASTVFMTRRRQHLHHLLNEMSLYTWSDAIPSLAAGSTSADLKLRVSGETAANAVRDLIRDGTVTHLLIQERLNPVTGLEAGRDPGKRQLLQLLSGEAGAETIRDPLPVEETWLVRVHWRKEDQLKRDYCFTVDCTDGKVEDVSLFHGNLASVYYGRPVPNYRIEADPPVPNVLIFKEASAELSNPYEFHYERTNKRGAICRLPAGPLAYLETPLGGEVPPRSTLIGNDGFIDEDMATPYVTVVSEDGLRDEPWFEIINFIHSHGKGKPEHHFVVETDEQGRSLIRFGNGINGERLPDGAEVHCAYQAGRGADGNIGADKLTNFDKAAFEEIARCWNPFDVTNGRDWEPRAEIIRRAPEAYRYRQLRAVTLGDYVRRAEELAEVSKAAARYVWTGSWRAVRLAVDPVGVSVLTDALRRKIAGHLEAVKLIGDDLEIRPPRFVPLKIEVSLCIHPDFWPEDVRAFLEQAFSDGFTPDGRMAFFHPDRWTFGQALRASQLLGWIQSITGVDHVTEMSMKRWNEVTPGPRDIIEVGINEIIQVKNDPDHLEKGFIFFDINGGRR